MGQEILEVAKQVYQGQYEVGLSVLPCWCQDQFMAEHPEELSQHLIRTGLCGVIGAAQSLSRRRRHSHAHSSSLARSSSEKSRRKFIKWLRGDFLMRCSSLHSRCNRSRMWQHQSQSQGYPHPSKAPPCTSSRRHLRCAWRHNQVEVDHSRLPGYTEAATSTTTRIQTTCLGVWVTSPWRCRTPSQDSNRGPAGSDIPDFLGDGCCLKQPDRQTWIPLQNVAHLMGVPTSEPT